MKDLKNKKIFLTGGHAATTALSVVTEIQKRYKNNSPRIFWVGPKYAMEGTSVPTLALEVLPKIGVEFIPIVAGRLLRKFNKWTFVSFVKFPIGFLHAFLILIIQRPDLILSFGGYAAFPVVVVGYFMGIDIVIHDETYHYNFTNRLTSFFAKQICVSRRSSLKFYDNKKTIITGNPILKSISNVSLKNRLGKNIYLYITGGSSGSKSINSAVAEVLVKILHNYFVIHQTGKLDFNKFKNIKKNLPSPLRKRYKLFDTVSPFKVHEIFEKSDIIISRAGANIVSEIILARRPAILIPLVIGKWSEQEFNARYAVEYGVARVIKQDDLSGAKLCEELTLLKKDWEEIIDNIKDKKSPDEYADKRLVDVLEKYLI